MVSFSFPQVVPPRALRTLFLDCTFPFILSECSVKERRLSNVTPSNFGFFTVGTFCPFISMGSWILASLEKVEKMVLLILMAR